jgi:hypothetical protein
MGAFNSPLRHGSPRMILLATYPWNLISHPTIGVLYDEDCVTTVIKMYVLNEHGYKLQCYECVLHVSLWRHCNCTTQQATGSLRDRWFVGANLIRTECGFFVFYSSYLVRRTISPFFNHIYTTVLSYKLNRSVFFLQF